MEATAIKIGTRTLSSSLVASILADIKKGGYAIDDSLVRDELVRSLPDHRRLLSRLAEASVDPRIRRGEDYKALVKAVRMRLRRSVSMFTSPKKERELLFSHASARERHPCAPELYKRIFAITGKPRRILDLACGLNPLSAAQMGLDRVDYEAWDAAKPLIDAVDAFFSTADKKKIRGIARQVDLHRLRTEDLFAKTPPADVCFLFKALDSLEPAKGHRFAELLLTRVPARFVVATFATKTIAGKPMRHPYRGWMDKMLARKGWPFEVFTVGGEIVYVIEKERRASQN